MLQPSLFMECELPEIAKTPGSLLGTKTCRRRMLKRARVATACGQRPAHACVAAAGTDWKSDAHYKKSVASPGAKSAATWILGDLYRTLNVRQPSQGWRLLP